MLPLYYYSLYFLHRMEFSIQEMLQPSDGYVNNIRYSQIIGWSLAIALCFIALAIYILFRSLSPMNYIQATISSECKKEMEEAITKAFVSSIIEKVNCVHCYAALLACFYACCVVIFFIY